MGRARGGMLRGTRGGTGGFNKRERGRGKRRGAEGGSGRGTSRAGGRVK